MKKILVTGAGGYIGSVLVNKLLKKDYSVTAVDRFFFGQELLPQHKKLSIIREDSRKLTQNLFHNIDAVIDLVAISNDPAGELFQKSTIDINAAGRINTARLAKKAGVKQYILPSSASIYGYHDEIRNEQSTPNPLTTYARANVQAENGILPLADNNFSVTVLRQSTIYGYSPRMRFDLAINGMAYGCWKNGNLPLMRDGKQYRPMVHIQDTTDVMLKLLEIEHSTINQQIFNVGSNEQNFQIDNLAEKIVSIAEKILNKKITIEWYGDPDKRSYRLDFSKIEKTLKWQAHYSIESGVEEIIQALKTGKLDKTAPTITLEWYQELVRWHKIIKEVELYNGIVDIE